MKIINFDESIIEVLKQVWGNEKTMDKSALKEMNKFLNYLAKKIMMALNLGQKNIKFKVKSNSRRKTTTEKRSECKDKNMVYDNNNNRCRKSLRRSKRKSMHKSRSRKINLENIKDATEAVIPHDVFIHANYEANRYIKFYNENKKKQFDCKNITLAFSCTKTKQLIDRYITNFTYTNEVLIYFTAILDYLVADIGELSGEGMNDKDNIIKKDNIITQVKRDENMKKLFDNLYKI